MSNAHLSKKVKFEEEVLPRPTLCRSQTISTKTPIPVMGYEEDEDDTFEVYSTDEESSDEEAEEEILKDLLGECCFRCRMILLTALGIPYPSDPSKLPPQGPPEAPTPVVVGPPQGADETSTTGGSSLEG